jgi:hypothetical protein
VTTFDGLLSRIRQQTLGYTKDQASLSELAVSMTASDTTFAVDTATVTNISRGLVEIDDELLLVKSYDRTSGVVTLMGGLNGRGVEGSTAATHAVQALVTADPRFPRIRIKEAINDTIHGVYPQLLVFATTEITNTSVVYEYGMPADAKDVWSVADQTVGPTKVWMQGRSWKFNPRANTTDFPTGKSVQLFDAVTPGRAMRVTYVKEPSVLVNGSDVFETVTGLSDRCADLITYGACARLLPAYEAARLQQSSIESTERAPLVPPSSASKTAQYYMAMYQQRLAEERALMFDENPQVQFFAGA